MTACESEQAMSVNPEPSFYQRLSEVEKQVHTLQHTLRQFENERLPQRLVTMETVVPRIVADVAQIEKSVDELNRVMSASVGELRDSTRELGGTIKTWGTVGVVLVTLVQLLPSLKGLLP